MDIYRQTQGEPFSVSPVMCTKVTSGFTAMGLCGAPVEETVALGAGLAARVVVAAA